MGCAANCVSFNLSNCQLASVASNRLNNGKSITNLEYLHAKEKGIPTYVFVDKQLHDNMRIWRSNKDAIFSTVVDNPKIYEFVSGIYDESNLAHQTTINNRKTQVWIAPNLRNLINHISGNYCTTIFC